MTKPSGFLRALIIVVAAILAAHAVNLVTFFIVPAVGAAAAFGILFERYLWKD